MKSLRRLNRKGQSLVEFALVLPLILLLVVGMLEFARIWNLHQVMTDAVREGARRALVADVPPAPVDSVYSPIWRYLNQAGYDAQYARMGICDAPATNCAGLVTSGSRPAPGSKYKKTGEKMTVVLEVPYRIWVLGNRQLLMKTALTVRNE